MSQSVQYRVRTAADLFAGLESPEVGLQLAVLQAVHADPARALRLGRVDERDLIDVLLAVLGRSASTQHQAAILSVLVTFDDPRVFHECKRAFSLPGLHAMRELAALGLASGSPAELRSFLTPWLLQNRDPHRACLAARLLASHPDLDDAERIRIAVAAPEISLTAGPAIDSANREAWLAELGGPFAGTARARIEQQGESAFIDLKAQWPTLPFELRSWLLRWGVRDHLIETMVLLKQALGDGDEDVQHEALSIISRLGPMRAAFADELVRFRNQPNPRLLRAAIRAGLRGLEWERLVAQLDHPPLRLIAIRCLAEEGGENAIEPLLELLLNKSWRVRSAATAALSSIGEQAATRVRPLLQHTRPDVRVAAAQVCLAAGHQDWLP